MHIPVASLTPHKVYALSFCDCKVCSTLPHAILMLPPTSAIGVTSAPRVVRSCVNMWGSWACKERNRISLLLAGKAPLGPVEKCSMYQGLTAEPRNLRTNWFIFFCDQMKLSLFGQQCWGGAVAGPEGLVQEQSHCEFWGNCKAISQKERG